jgi:hydroxyacylglutathione hydrolase
MIEIKKFIFNPFNENTYVLSDDTGQCLFVDPGCQSKVELSTLKSYIAEKNLVPVGTIITHYHIDHILGNNFIYENYGLKPRCHEKSRSLWKSLAQTAAMFGIKPENPIFPEEFVEEGDIISFGNSELKVLYTPGHAIGSICLVNDIEHFVITGDVLFHSSIGRTDLPTGDYKELRQTIMAKLFTLPDNYIVFPGHGPETSIGYEKMNNPFL